MSEQFESRQAADNGHQADGYTTNDVIEVEDIVLEYSASDTCVIDGESVSIPEGKVTALVGPNGSGKSTLLKGIANRLAPTNGTVLLDGRAVHEFDSKELARRMGLLSQEHEAPSTLTVEGLAYHGRYPHRGFFESVSREDKVAVERALYLAGIRDLRDREIESLSGGQKQLAWIAMVLAQESDVLLLDEPTTFLDLEHQLQVMEIVETLRVSSDITVVLVLHDVTLAGRYSDHMIALSDGEIISEGPPPSVMTADMFREVFNVSVTVDTHNGSPRITPESSLE